MNQRDGRALLVFWKKNCNTLDFFFLAGLISLKMNWDLINGIFKPKPGKKATPVSGFTINQLEATCTAIKKFAHSKSNISSENAQKNVVEAFRRLAEMIIWGDQVIFFRPLAQIPDFQQNPNESSGVPLISLAFQDSLLFHISLAQFRFFRLLC